MPPTDIMPSTGDDYDTKKIYSNDPLEIAKSYEDAGIRHLHLVDLDGAKSNQIVNYPTLERIASSTNLIIDFGGGLKSTKDVEIAFNSGAKKITGGSIAVLNRPLFLEWINSYGSDKIILGADCNNRMIATNGWLEQSELDVLDFIRYYKEEGVVETIVTDIQKDGMLQGPSIELYQEILSQTNINLVASGGVSSIEDLRNLKKIGCEGAIIGKAIYEGKISLKEISLLC